MRGVSETTRDGGRVAHFFVEYFVNFFKVVSFLNELGCHLYRRENSKRLLKRLREYRLQAGKRVRQHKDREGSW